MLLEQKMMAFALLGAGWVMWLLVGLSVLCLAVAVERALYFSRNRTSAELQGLLQDFLKGGAAESFRDGLKKLSGTQARVLQAGLEAAEETGPEGASEAIAGHLIYEKEQMDRGLIVLGTTGSNAPFLGLFGTVLGIIKAFHDLANQADADGGSAVMAGISEALVATAIGLLVAIPAVVLFNIFQKKSRRVLSTTESLCHLVLARLQRSASS